MKQPLWHVLTIYRHGPCSPSTDIPVWEIEINKQEVIVTMCERAEKEARR